MTRLRRAIRLYHTRYTWWTGGHLWPHIWRLSKRETQEDDRAGCVCGNPDCAFAAPTVLLPAVPDPQHEPEPTPVAHQGAEDDEDTTQWLHGLSGPQEPDEDTVWRMALAAILVRRSGNRLVVVPQRAGGAR